MVEATLSRGHAVAPLREATAARGLRGHMPELDGVRGIAILMVFLYHYGGGKQSTFWPIRAVGNIVNFGWIGVPLFFALSGFLITGILWDSFATKDWWPRFLIRRSLRIFPLYYLVLACASAVYLRSQSVKQLASGIWVYVFYLQNVPALSRFTATLPSNLWLGHLWSLAVEEQFYIVWPFLLFLCAKNRLVASRMTALLWIASFAFRLFVVGTGRSADWALFSLPARAGELLTGAYLALYIRGPSVNIAHLSKHLPKVLATSSALFLGLCAYVLSQHLKPETSDLLMSSVGFAILSILCPSVIAFSMQNQTAQAWFSGRLLRWLGKLSYGIYIYHFLLRFVFDHCATLLAPKWGSTTHLLLLDLVAVVGTLAVASLSFYTYERSILVLKQRWV